MDDLRKVGRALTFGLSSCRRRARRPRLEYLSQDCGALGEPALPTFICA